MDKAIEKVIRNTLHISDDELLTIWRLPGYRDCLLGDPEMGVVNCPLGFDTGKWSPSNPPAWMKQRLSKELLAHCQHCQGKPQLTAEEAEISTKIVKVIIGNDEAHRISTKEAKKDEG